VLGARLVLGGIPYERSSLSHEEEGETRKVDFIYPVGLRWGCTKCGACCMDAPKRERRILLLPGDLERLREAAGETEAYSGPLSGGGPFVAEMRKAGGRCFFLGDSGCRVYPQRPLLCRMYPLWVEREGDLLIIRVDGDCPGLGSGEELDEVFFRLSLGLAVSERGDV